METLIDAIRSAVAASASAETRATGAQACRTILAALEAKPGESLASVPVPTSPLQAIIGAFRTMSPDQLMDLAIAKLKTALPAGAEVPSVSTVRIPIVPVDRFGGGR